jgi:outer membrane receptor protein involved in Fe transport
MVKQLRRLAALAGLVLAAAVQAQAAGGIAGVAMDADDGRPLVGAIVQLTGPGLDAPRTVVSEDGGKFTLDELPPGAYALSVRLDGYQAFARADVAVKEGETLRLGAWLTPEGKEPAEVVVTGSRIRRKDVTTAAPVTIIDRKQLDQSGVVGLGEFLQRLPSQGNSLNAQRNYGNDGEVRVDLRSLESKRTLVLVNGRRWVSGGGGGTEGIVDLNTIPLAAVDHIEVLKDGASAIYGSDAIAGVVNVVLKKKFEGTQVSAQAGTSSRGDAESWDFNGSTGLASERGSIFFSLGFQEQRPLLASARRFSAVPMAYDYSTGRPVKTGSFLTSAGDIVFHDIGGICGGDLSGLTGPMRQACQDYNAGGYNDFTYDPATHAWRLKGMSDTYNVQPQSYLLTPARRLQLFSTGNVALGKQMRGFYEASFSNRRSRTNAAPQPVQTDVSRDSVYNPFGQDLTVLRRMNEFGPRSFGQEQNTFRVVGGLEGDVGAWAGPLKGWRWELSYNYGRNLWTDTSRGVLRQSALDAAAGPSYLDGGVPTCGTPGAPIANCVPIDLLHGQGTASPAQLSSLGFLGTAHGENEMQVFSADANGKLVQLWANRPAALALGFDWRREAGGYFPDPITASGDNTDSNMRPVSGAYTAREAYAELSIPLVSQRLLVEDLELTAALRNVRYSSFGSNTSYKLGARWMPVRDVTLRGTWSTAFRAPNIDELYQGALDAWESASDPCGNPTDPAVRQQCLAEIGHVSGDETTQVKTREGGNVHLKPETARIFTAGVVIEPRWLRNLAVTVDYWDIRITRTVNTLGTQNILDGCYTGAAATSNAAECARIHRDPDTGRIDYVDDSYANVGATRTAGLDLGARWLLPAHELGDFRFDLDSTYLARYDRTTADGTVHAAGTYDLAFILPRWRWNGRVGWQRGPLGLGTEARYTGGFKECAGSSCARNPEFVRQVRSNVVFDLTASYERKSGLGTSTVLVGVRNVFDSAPPTIYNAADNNTDPAYDFVGRYVWARVTQTF